MILIEHDDVHSHRVSPSSPLQTKVVRGSWALFRAASLGMAPKQDIGPVRSSKVPSNLKGGQCDTHYTD